MLLLQYFHIFIRLLARGNDVIRGWGQINKGNCSILTKETDTDLISAADLLRPVRTRYDISARNVTDHPLQIIRLIIPD